MAGEQILSRRRKAAVVAQLALSEGGPFSLAELPEEVQVTLARELGALGIVDRTTLEAVAEEFAQNIEGVGFAGPGSVARALEVYGERLSVEVAERLREEGANAPNADPWPAIVALSLDRLERLMLRESTEVCAVVLSKLPVSKAAELLGQLPGERARRITYGMSRTRAVTPAAVVRIGRALRKDYCTAPAPAFASAAGQRLGAILNNSRTDTRENVLEGLGQEDPDFAEEVRRAIFAFSDIPRRIRPPDVPKILRMVDNSVVITALAAAKAAGGKEGAALNYVLENISQRMATQLGDEINERGPIRKSDGEKAVAELVSAVREAVTRGEITLKESEDE